MDDNNENFIVVGRFGAPFGVKGWLKVQSFTEPADNILVYQPWYAELKEGIREVKLLASQNHHKAIVVQVEGCNDKEQTVLYRNVNILVHRNALADLGDNEYYCSDLEGLTVYTVEGDELGKIDYVLPTGSNDVLVIKGDKEYLVPYKLHDVIKAIDLNARTMVVDWDKNF